MTQSNPFKPSFGRVPLYLAGREAALDEITAALDAEWDAPCLTSLVVGARGTGKTALITQIANEALSRGWVTANVACGSGMLEDLYGRTLESAGHLAEAQPASHLTAVGLGLAISLERSRDETSAPNWRTRMNRIFEQLDKTETGLLITIDEVRADIPEMIEFAATYQQFIREEKRIALFMAGLPGNANALLTDKSVSFLRRAERLDLGRIEDDDVRDALLHTAAHGGKAIEEDALGLMVSVIDGYAYLLQLVGYRSWVAAGKAPSISLAAAQAGVASAKKQMAAKVFDVTLQELSAGDYKFLAAMTQAGADPTLADVAAKLGKSTSYASTYRRRMQSSGIISERHDGTLRFDLPGFGEYLAKQTQA